MNVPHALTAFFLIIAISLAGWPITNLILTLSRRTHTKNPEPRGNSANDKTGTKTQNENGATTDGGLRGGLWIGLVERFAAAATIFLGQPALIAVIVAIKGLGRFKEISSPDASERFVLGTLASLTWATLAAAAGAAMLNAWFI